MSPKHQNCSEKMSTLLPNLNWYITRNFDYLNNVIWNLLVNGYFFPLPPIQRCYYKTDFPTDCTLQSEIVSLLFDYWLEWLLKKGIIRLFITTFLRVGIMVLVSITNVFLDMGSKTNDQLPWFFLMSCSDNTKKLLVILK